MNGNICKTSCQQLTAKQWALASNYITVKHSHSGSQSMYLCLKQYMEWGKSDYGHMYPSKHVESALTVSFQCQLML